jgi:peptidoglycan/xylan/chitin deacetylase (PgdA/CDA1 family)
MLKRLVKRAVQIPVAVAGPHRWPGRRQRLVAFTYHRILPREHPAFAREQPGMVVTPETFARHLRWIKRYFEPLTLGAWLAGDARTVNRPACAITFDDGWGDNHEFALPLLRSAGVSATLFVVSDFVGTRRDFWPGRVQKLLSSGCLENFVGDDRDWLLGALRGYPREDAGDRLVESLKAYPEREIEDRLTRLEADLQMPGDPEPVMLDWEQIRDMISDGTVELGSHTRNHRRLDTGIGPEEMRDEVVGSADVIEQATGQRPALFCYPNGNWDPDADRLVRQIYRGACLARGGWNRPSADPFELGRIGMHEDVSASRTAFLARACGVF